MKILGIDPGLSGAFALYDGADLAVHDMPTVEILRGRKKKRELDLAVVRRILANLPVDMVWIERVGAMPGQGVTSMFSFGRSVGQIEGMLAALQFPISYVTPQSWKKALIVPEGKDGARHRACQLMPAHAHYFSRVKDDGRAEAALIAYFGRLMRDRRAEAA